MVLRVYLETEQAGEPLVVAVAVQAQWGQIVRPRPFVLAQTGLDEQVGAGVGAGAEEQEQAQEQEQEPVHARPEE